MATIQMNQVVTPPADLNLQWMRCGDDVGSEAAEILFIIGLMVAVALAQGMI